MGAQKFLDFTYNLAGKLLTTINIANLILVHLLKCHQSFEQSQGCLRIYLCLEESAVKISEFVLNYSVQKWKDLSAKLGFSDSSVG